MTQPLRIVHGIRSLDLHQGGPLTVVASLAEAQRAAGHSVQIAIRDHAWSAPALEQLRQAHWGIESIPIINRSNSSTSPLHFRGQRADIVHLHGLWCPHVVALARMAQRSGVPYVLAPHGSLGGWSMRQKTLKKRLAYHLYFRRVLSRAAFVHVNSRSEGEDLRRLGFRGTLRQVPHGVKPPPKESPQLADLTLPGLSLGPERRFILFLGRLSRVKSPVLLVEAFVWLASELPEVDLVLAGPAEDQLEPLREKMRSMDSSTRARVHLPGEVFGQAKEALLRACSVLCLPSEYESFGMVLLEAMNYSKPVVFTSGCGLGSAEIGDAGIQAERTASSLGHALRQCLGEAGELMGGRGQALVAANYRWSNIVAQLDEFYREARNAQ